MSLFRPNELQLATAISALYDALSGLGIADVIVSGEVAQFEVATTQVGKPNSVGEHFRRSLNTLPPSHVLWAGAYDEAGQCVCTVASQFQDIQGRSLERHLVDYFERIFASEDGGNVSLKRGSAAFLDLVEGPFVYVGEGHVRSDWRGQNLLGLLQRMLILSAYFRWRPKLIYGFMRPEKVKSGYHFRWGYSYSCPAGFIWEKRPAHRDWHDPHFVALASEGICRLVGTPLEDPVSRRRESSQTEMLRPAASGTAE